MDEASSFKYPALRRYILLVLPVLYVAVNFHTSFQENKSEMIANVQGASSRALEVRDGIFLPQGATSRHAYAFLLAGCDQKESTYLGGLYGVLVAHEMIRKSGSTNDVVLMVRMATATKEETLPAEIEELLEKVGIIFHYIPKVETDNFYTAIMEKFRILSWIAYSRVLFLDTDVMPLCNLDYVFELSEGKTAVLRENLVLASRNAPADAGFFMLEPNIADYLQLREIIADREKHGKLDKVKGWGHVITPPDKWVAKYEEGTLWDYYGAIADQGLLYHWTKYVKKSVTIVINDLIENWSVAKNNTDGEAVMIDSSRVLFGDGCLNRKKVNKIPRECKGHYPPAKDYIHFCANDKPWLQHGPPTPAYKLEDVTPYHIWFDTLQGIFQRNGFKADLSNLYFWPEFGFALEDKQVVEHVRNRLNAKPKSLMAKPSI